MGRFVALSFTLLAYGAKRLSTVLTLACQLTFIASPANAVQDGDVWDARLAIVHVVGDHAQGSGVAIIRDGHLRILTTSQIVAGSRTLTLILPYKGSLPIQAQVEVGGTEDDLALLKPAFENKSLRYYAGKVMRLCSNAPNGLCDAHSFSDLVSFAGAGLNTIESIAGRDPSRQALFQGLIGKDSLGSISTIRAISALEIARSLKAFQLRSESLSVTEGGGDPGNGVITDSNSKSPEDEEIGD